VKGSCKQDSTYQKRRGYYWLAERLTVFKKHSVPWSVLVFRVRAADPLRTVYTCRCVGVRSVSNVLPCWV
jgi:hypothetical protein